MPQPAAASRSDLCRGSPLLSGYGGRNPKREHAGSQRAGRSLCVPASNDAIQPVQQRAENDCAANGKAQENQNVEIQGIPRKPPVSVGETDSHPGRDHHDGIPEGSTPRGLPHEGGPFLGGRDLPFRGIPVSNCLSIHAHCHHFRVISSVKVVNPRYPRLVGGESCIETAARLPGSSTPPCRG